MVRPCSSFGQVNSNTAVSDTIKESPYGVFSMFKGKPGKAGLYSLIVPGAGQLYNKKYLKIPLFIGAEGIAVTILITNIRKYNDWNEGYINMANGTTDNYRGLTDISAVRSHRDSQRQMKDFAWIGLIAVHIITAADAFVDRHLIEFDVEDDIAIKINPVSPYPGFNLIVSF